MNKITKALLVAALLGSPWLLFPSLALAGCTGSSPTWTSTPDQASVASCVSQAHDGDTVTIAAGSATWTTGVTISGKGLTIQGTGTPNSSPSQIGASSSCSQTVITLGGSGNFDGFTFLPSVSSSLTHISCIKFTAAVTNSCAAFTAGGACNSATCSQLRADNLTFDASLAQSTACSESGSLMVIDNFFGVADHNTATGGAAKPQEFLGIQHSSWQGVGQYGDNSWHMPDTFGTAQAFYAENNSVGPNVLGSENESNAPTGRGGGRLAVRFSSCLSCEYGSLVSWHGTDSSGRYRGGRQAELYASTLNCPTAANCQAATGIRSGVALQFGNTWTTGSSTNEYMTIAEYRISGVNSPPWNTCAGSYDQASPLVCLDQPCRARGTLLSGATPTTGWSHQVIDPCYEWNDTGANPPFGRVSPNPGSPVWASQNRDYYLASFGPIASIPTSCTPGATVANDDTRPDLPGQGYATTDTGNWNQSGIAFGSANQTQGQLYVCKSSNSNPIDVNGNPSSCRAKNTGDNNYWCLYYTPYTYPHPLTQGGGGSSSTPNPPTGFQAVAQ